MEKISRSMQFRTPLMAIVSRSLEKISPSMAIGSRLMERHWLPSFGLGIPIGEAPASQSHQGSWSFLGGVTKLQLGHQRLLLDG
jgi:hypothetical protein